VANGGTGAGRHRNEWVKWVRVPFECNFLYSCPAVVKTSADIKKKLHSPFAVDELLVTAKRK